MIELPDDLAAICEEILTNFVTSSVADVGVELQGRLGLVTALVRDLRFDILHVGAAQGSQVGGVVRVTKWIKCQRFQIAIGMLVEGLRR